MEFLSAFSGLERIAIIAGAIAIGYWGFRLFASDRVPGLIFMSVACAVLVAVLATGGRHLESLQSSVNVTPTPETGAKPMATPTPGPATKPEAEPPTTPTTDDGLAQPADTPQSRSVTAAEPSEPTMPDDILSARELGGRVVSVKSENVTLEWTPPSE